MLDAFELFSVDKEDGDWSDILPALRAEPGLRESSIRACGGPVRTPSLIVRWRAVVLPTGTPVYGDCDSGIAPTRRGVFRYSRRRRVRTR